MANGTVSIELILRALGIGRGDEVIVPPYTFIASISALIIYGRWRWFGLLGRKKDIIIRWNDIQLIGEDTILVNFDMPKERMRNQRTKMR